MEPILDENSLIPCAEFSIGDRILDLAKVLKTLDEFGAPRILRCVRDAADRDISAGLGLKVWCFDRSVDQTARTLIALRLSKQPFIDGPEGLFSLAEGTRVIEPTIDSRPALGAGLAALTDGALVALRSATDDGGGFVGVNLTFLSEEGESNQLVTISRFATCAQALAQKIRLVELIERSVRNGPELLNRQIELFPRLRIGADAISQFSELCGNEVIFRQLLRHLRALNDAASSELRFEPLGISWSKESNSTLCHSRYGPMRDFRVPEGFEFERWSDHSKLTGGAGHRLYFRAEKSTKGYVVLIGYFGPHLSTVKY